MDKYTLRMLTLHSDCMEQQSGRSGQFTQMLEDSLIGLQIHVRLLVRARLRAMAEVGLS